MEGIDAIISTLGGRPRQPTTVYSHGLATIEQAMRSTGTRRLITLSAGALDLGPQVPLFQRIVTQLVVRMFFRDGYADMAKMEAALRTNDLDWTVVRVPGLTNKTAAATPYRVSQAPLDRPSTISRADLASYLVSILDSPTTYRKVLEISR
jgi:putative NADH-flavin reductase